MYNYMITKKLPIVQMINQEQNFSFIQLNTVLLFLCDIQV
jgi:hypothetical protein